MIRFVYKSIRFHEFCDSMACENRYMNITMKLFVALGVINLLASLADCGVSMHHPFFCYSTDPIRSIPYTIASMNDYDSVRQFNFTTADPFTPAGTPSKFWYLGREAARFFANEPDLQPLIDFAESSVRDDIVRNYEAGRTTLCRPDFEAIRDFDKDAAFGGPLTTELASTVMESGVIAMQNIARRFQNMFPDILTRNYSSENFYFRHMSDQMTNVSIRAFANGLFEAGSENVIYEEVPAIDWFLAAFNFCPQFFTDNWTARRVAFSEGPEMEELVEQVNRRLGFTASNRLSFNQIENMWNYCRHQVTFETANFVTGSNSAWCAAFSVDHYRIFEYWTELGTFHLNGYGAQNQRLLENLSCGLMQDLLAHMQSNNNADPNARILVTNIFAFQPMFVLLGVFRDTWPMHEHNFAQQINRRWLGGFISGFSANIAVVRYDSDDGNHDIVFLLNEQPMLVPGCDQRGVCKLSVLVNRFQRFINANCAASFCSND